MNATNSLQVQIRIDNNFFPKFKEFADSFKKELKIIKIKEEKKDPTEFTKEEYFQMIEEASKGPKIRMKFEDLIKYISE